MNLVDSIDALLPQTQCAKCGFQGCRPYAQAIADGCADINQCPPGGTAGIASLARLLGRPEKPLDPKHGREQPRAAALIEESACIGCTLCIQACPTDAIIGAAKRMHTVVTEWCSGCELCLPACPVDCIAMVALEDLARCGDQGAAKLARETTRNLAHLWRTRYEERNARRTLERKRREARLEKMAGEKMDSPQAGPDSAEITRKRATIQAALERVRRRRAQDLPSP